MRTSELAPTLAHLISTRIPGFVWGSPGIGKSDVVRQTAAAMDRPVVDVRCVLLDPVDLRGLPTLNGDGRAHWAPPSFLPSDPASKAVIFFDELPQAPVMVQAACLQLILDRRLGEYVMPEGVSMIAAGNRAEDRAGSNRMITPLLNRFVHLDVEVSVDDWQTWALGASVDPRVRAFIGYRPACLFSFDPKSADRSFPTPRSWRFVSDLVRGLPQSIRPFDLVAGAVGKGAAAEFLSFCEIYTSLPSIPGIMAAPDSTPVPTEPAVCYALCGAMVEHLRNNKKHADAFATYAARLSPEFAILAMRDAPAVCPEILNTPAGAAFIRANRDVLLASRA